MHPPDCFLAERRPQAGHVCQDGPGRAVRGGTVAPQAVDHPARRHRLARPLQQHGEDASLLRPADRDDLAAGADLDRAEHPVAQRNTSVWHHELCVKSIAVCQQSVRRRPYRPIVVDGLQTKRAVCSPLVDAVRASSSRCARAQPPARRVSIEEAGKMRTRSNHTGPQA